MADPSKDSTPAVDAQVNKNLTALVSADSTPPFPKSGSHDDSHVNPQFTSAVPTPMEEEQDHQGGQDVPLSVDEILKRGLVADPDWMKVRTEGLPREPFKPFITFF